MGLGSGFRFGFFFTGIICIGFFVTDIYKVQTNSIGYIAGNTMIQWLEHLARVWEVLGLNLTVVNFFFIFLGFCLSFYLFIHMTAVTLGTVLFIG